jgi:hypothetical protein
LIILIILGEKYKLWSSSLCNFLQPPITSSLLGLNILLNTLFSDTLSLCSSLNVRDQVSHPYRTSSPNPIKKLRGFGPLANYADRVTAACWRSSASSCG